MTVALTLFDKFEKNLAKKKIDFSADTFKAILTNSAPAQTTAEVLVDITQIANGNGYTTDGVTLTGVALTEPSAGIQMVDADDFEWTSSGAGMATFRYGVLRCSTSDFLVGWWDHGAGLAVPVGAKYQVTVNASGLFRITRSP
jgi:hypothetical protein